MAGDINIHEEAIVGDVSAGALDVDELAGVVGEGGEAIHQYGRRVLIAAAPSDTAREIVERQVPGATMATEAGAISESARSDLDEIEALGLEAFALRQSDDYASAKSQRSLDGEPWDSEEATAPDLSAYAVSEAPEEVAEAVPAGARLGGRVAVGLIIVEGPTANNLQFTAAERTQVVAEVQNGLGWLGSAGTLSYTARVTWVYDIQRVTLNVTPNYPPGSYEAMEAPWRDPALQQLGFQAGFAGVQAYVEALRARLNTTSAYCAFFTKYPLRHFAYASFSVPRLVMHYNNDNWGPDNIDRVFAHESGHIFGAPDEYAASNCTCGGAWGFHRKPNANCATCAPGGVDCIMKENTWQMCDHTPLHLGLDVKVPEVRELSPTLAARDLREVFLEPEFTGDLSATDPWVFTQSPAVNALVAPFSRVRCVIQQKPVK
jgi:hypothetical protein